MSAATHGVVELLDVLGFQPADAITVCHQPPGGAFAAHWTVAADAAKVIDKYPTENVWFSVNGLRADKATGRGGVEDVTRLTSLYLDLDHKPGGLPTKEAATAVIGDLSGMLGTKPAAVILSGHGVQPIWPVEADRDSLLDGDNRAGAVALLRRFGRLAEHVATSYGGHVDSVFDLARVLRAPGSVNLKDPAVPVPVKLTVIADSRPLNMAEISERLDEYGAVEQPGDRDGPTGEILAPVAEWTWSPSTHPAVTRAVTSWSGATPAKGRHPWLLGVTTSLAFARRLGMVTEDDHRAAVHAVAGRFRWLLEHQDPVRREALSEVRDALAHGINVAQRKNEDETRADWTFWTDLVAGETWTANLVAVEVATDDEGNEAHRRIVLTPASDIAPRRVKWLWLGRLAAGALALLAGPEGLGKSTLAYWLTAQITRGVLPGEDHGRPRSVLVCAAEDSWSRTIVPRLIAAGADLARVYRIDVMSADDIHVGLVLPRDLPALEKSATEVDASLLLLDPLMSRLDDRLDTHRDGDVRRALEPLVAVAERTGMAVVGLIHHNKSGSSDPLQLVMASKAFTAVARSVHSVIRDPDDETETRRLFGTPKNNLGRTDLPVLSFTIIGYPVDTSDGTAWTGKLEWGADAAGTIGDALARGVDGATDRTATTEASMWLEDWLSERGGTDASLTIKKAGHATGHTERALRGARGRLHLEVTTSGFPRVSYWSLPGTQPETGTDHA